MSGRIRLGLLGLRWALLGAALALVAACTLPNVFGMRSFVVLSGSMQPALGTGDVVVERSVAPKDLRIGDVVTFRDPMDDDRLITHRVRDIRIADGRTMVTTKGDANTGTEGWSVPADGRVGRVVYRVPAIGRIIAPTNTPAGRIGLVVVPVLLLAAIEVVRLWRTPEAAEGAVP